jgi:hypothetical protein
VAKKKRLQRTQLMLSEAEKKLAIQGQQAEKKLAQQEQEADKKLAALEQATQKKLREAEEKMTKLKSKHQGNDLSYLYLVYL